MSGNPYKETTTELPYRERAVADYSVENVLVPANGSVTLKVRGLGQCGVANRVVISDTEVLVSIS